MAQEFHIRRGSVLPKLRMELINDGRYDFHRSMLYNNAIRSATDIKFSMKDTETDILKVSNQPAEIRIANDDSCAEKYIIQYTWTPRDTRKPGIYEGWFDIYFNMNDNLSDEDGTEYPNGLLKMPIEEHLIIYID